MTAPLTPADLAALRALCDKATPGPWTAYGRGIDSEAPETYGQEVVGLKTEGRAYMQYEVLVLSEADAAFIAASREAMPRLLDALEEARESISRLNRRAQAADKALANPGSADPRDRTVGRALANWGYARALERAEAAEAERDEAKAISLQMAEAASRTFRDQRDAALAEVASLTALNTEIHEAKDALGTEVERLRGALREIARVDASVGERGEWRRGYCERGDIARTVLGEEGA